MQKKHKLKEKMTDPSQPSKSQKSAMQHMSIILIGRYKVSGI